MNDFLYCYLSPFMVGLLVIIAVIVAVIGICWLVSIGGEKIQRVYNYKVPYSSTAGKVVRGVGNSVAYIVVGIFLIGITIGASKLFWEIGIELLKRVVCR